MKIAVIGAGYVGLVTGACFAELGNRVTCIDIDANKIANLNKGYMPIYEPGLDVMVASNQEQDRLHFATTLKEAVLDHPQVIFIAVGTPSDHEGSADVRYVLEAARTIGATITQHCVIVDKSTVPVGVADKVMTIIHEELAKRGLDFSVDMVSNPEFLREGAAIDDFMKPDRIIIGLSSEKAKAIMSELYNPIVRNPEKIYFMNIKDAEMTKYVANAMLATKISFMNEMAMLCEKIGVDVENVRIGIGSDARIGNAFINPGCGYGGSCFPKDVRALIKMAEGLGFDSTLIRAVEERNYRQKRVLPNKVMKYFGDDLTGIVIGVWGLSFKPGTDDMREASSLVLLEQIIARNAKVLAYDPVAMSTAKTYVPEEWLTSGKLAFVEHQYDALKQVNALVLVTEWKPFCYPDLDLMKTLMRERVIFDGRNQYNPKQMQEAGFHYFGIGRVLDSESSIKKRSNQEIKVADFS